MAGKRVAMVGHIDSGKTTLAAALKIIMNQKAKPMTDASAPTRENIECSLALFFAANQMPHMSGDPRARLTPNRLRDLKEAAATIEYLFAPVIARLERERDEARAEKAELLDERKQFAKDWLDEKLRADAAEAALSAAKAEGMREAAGIAKRKSAINSGADEWCDGWGAACEEIEEAILAAIPETSK